MFSKLVKNRNVRPLSLSLCDGEGWNIPKCMDKIWIINGPKAEMEMPPAPAEVIDS